jgi:hypothetical protein
MMMLDFPDTYVARSPRWRATLHAGADISDMWPMGARSIGGRSHMATTQRRYEPCQVTASPFRLVRNKPVARAVGSRIGRSR